MRLGHSSSHTFHRKTETAHAWDAHFLRLGHGTSQSLGFWQAEGCFEFDIEERAFEETLSFQVWRDDTYSKDDYLGSTCFPIGELEAEHNGALFKKAVFRSELYSKKGELLSENGKFTTINFVAELVPNIEFSLYSSE